MRPSKERVLFRGIEVDLLVWDAVVYCAADLLLGSPTLAALVTYAAAAALAHARCELGKRSVARTSLIDARFLG